MFWKSDFWNHIYMSQETNLYWRLVHIAKNYGSQEQHLSIIFLEKISESHVGNISKNWQTWKLCLLFAHIVSAIFPLFLIFLLDILGSSFNYLKMDFSQFVILIISLWNRYPPCSWIHTSYLISFSGAWCKSFIFTFQGFLPIPHLAWALPLSES